jgi:hypothetical protein
MPKLQLNFKKILYLLVLFLLVFIPLYPKFPLLNVTGTFVAIRLEDIFISGIVGLWFFWILANQRLKEILRDPLNQALILFWGVGAVSVFSGIFITHTITSPSIGLLHLLRRIEFMCLLPIAYSVITSKKDLKVIFNIILIMTILICVYALGQQYLHWPLVSTTNSEFSKGQILYLTPDARVNSTFAGHYDLAIYLMMVLILISSMFFAVKKEWKVISLATAGLSFFVLVLTAARLSFVAAMFGIILSLVLTGKRWVVLLVIVVAVFAVIYPSQLRDRLISTVTVNLLNKGDRFMSQNQQQSARSKLNIPTLPTLKKATASGIASSSATAAGELASDITPGEPTDSTELGVYRSFNIRINQEWPRALRGFYKDPLLGTGYASIGIATDNDFLRSLGEVGLLGTFALFLALAEVLKRLYRVWRYGDRYLRYFVASMISIVVGFVINGLFIDVFESSKVAILFWMWLGFAIASEKLIKE